MEMLKRCTEIEVSDMVNLYWDNPETHFYEMLKMVYKFFKNTMKDIGEYDKMEANV